MKQGPLDRQVRQQSKLALGETEFESIVNVFQRPPSESLSNPFLQSDMTVQTIICSILACAFLNRRLKTTVVYHNSLL